MIFIVIHDTMLKRLSLGKLKSCVQVVTGFKSSGVFGNVRYFQPSLRYLKTSTIFQLPNVSETTAELAAEKKNAGEDVGVTTTPEERIIAAFSEYPSLTQVSIGHLKTFLCYLRELGFSVDDGIVMVNKCTDILGRSKSQLLQTVLDFKQCKFDDEDVVSILRSSPEYLLMQPTVIVSQCNSLRKYFSQTSLKLIFSNNTGIAAVKWEVIQSKLDYLINVMHVPRHEIAKSKVLDCPIGQIRARHLFLERAGLYKIPNPKLNIPNRNHELSDITDTPDDKFAVEIAGLTAEEYSVFQELLALEDNLRD